MSKGKSKAVIGRLRNSSFSRLVLFLLIANFVNLSANFYEGNILTSENVRMLDPIDTISELIFEWALDGNEDLIPDNGTQQNDNSLEKIKLALQYIHGVAFQAPDYIEMSMGFLMPQPVILGYLSADSPPPDPC